MDAGTGFKAQGSFGIPENIRKRLEEDQRTLHAPPKEEAEPAPKAEATPTDPKAVSEEEKAQEAVRKLKKFWEDELEIVITSRDMQDYLFKGRVIKDDIFIASYDDDKNPGKRKDFKITFQSHTPEDLEAVDVHMAAFRDKGKYTAEGLDNEKSIRLLSQVLLKADGRPLGKESEERYKNIKKLSGGVVGMISEAWDGFNTLLKISSREKKLLKK